ncbi:MAG: MoaD/ThiS family protein [Acidimicrobiales bacterium]
MLLFGPARDLAGAAHAELAGGTVQEVVASGGERFGPAFAELCRRAQVWVNGEPAAPGTPIGPADEVAVLPPVSGG